MNLVNEVVVVESGVEGVGTRGTMVLACWAGGERDEAGAAFCVLVIVVGVYEEDGFSWEEGKCLDGEVIAVWEA